ncbi:MAG: GNAT family N-acetyltransferase [Tahibacter sp.]
MHTRFHSRLDAIDPAAWNALLPDDNPFVDHTFLAGLEQHGCLRQELGWQAHHLGLYEGDALIGAAPLYLKGNSHGEFVFDWSWANAYAQHGLAYYPKLLCAVPYSPVNGPRLLVGTGERASALRQALLSAIAQETRRLGLSSAHMNFASGNDDESAIGTDWLARHDWQFHWENRNYSSFSDFLVTLKAKKRKNLRQERQSVLDAGVVCEWRDGRSLTDDDWGFVHQCYLGTFEEKGNHPALTRSFFQHLAGCMPNRILAVIARREHHPVAAALFLRSTSTLYGRYWGAIEHVPGLHFEACYYQGIDYCIRHGLARFEPGAQGEHKLARGFLPTRTHSRHYLVDPRFRQAIAHALREESAALAEYAEELVQHDPYAGPAQPV